MGKTILFGGFVFMLSGIFCLSSTAQFYFYDNDSYDNPMVYEFGVSAGAMNCLTDLGGTKGIGAKFTKDLNMGNTQACGGLYFALQYKYALGLRLEATFGRVTANDAILKPVAPSTFGRYERNLSFRSSISEVAVTAEFHPLFVFINWLSKEKEPPRFSPYVVGGIGYYAFNPQAKLNGNWIDLQPLSTEGQGFKEYPDREKYKLKQINFPVGAGIRYELSKMFNVRAEFMYRFLRTDYLDDVSKEYIDPALFANYLSGNDLNNALKLNDRQNELDPNHLTHTGDQRGYPKNKDCYFSCSIKFGLILGREQR